MLAALTAAVPLCLVGAGAAAPDGATFTFASWDIREDIQPQPICTNNVGYAKSTLRRQDCGWGRVSIVPAQAKPVKVEFIDSDGTVVDTQNVTASSAGRVAFLIVPKQHWDPGTITVRASVAAPDEGSGQATFVLNPLEIDLKATEESFAPGESVDVTGTVVEYDSLACVGCGADQRTPVPASLELTLHAPDGTQLAGPVSVQADETGAFAASFPGSATANLDPGAGTNYRLTLGVRATATYTDATPFVGNGGSQQTSGEWSGQGAGPVVLAAAAPTLLLENKFVSSTGWVKPGEKYPFRVFVKNFSDAAKNNVAVSIPQPPGARFLSAKPLAASGSATVTSGTIRWDIPTVAAGETATLVAEGRALTTTEDARIVWKDLSSTASMTYDGLAGALRSDSHGPKVIPPTGGFETARYGDKPFPMIPVDFRDRKHKSRHSGQRLETVVNSPDFAGSTFNLYQEMSFGQLFPDGTVPSADIAAANFEYEPGFRFTERDVKKPTCRGATLGNTKELYGTPVYPDRIRDGWYQLPGDTEYYGGDFPVFTATTIAIDEACGDTSKMIYDAVQIADPEIDYNQFDSDKDGLVDFTMVVFAGCGGNGSSQLGTIFCEDGVPYDNPWPHSSSLENSYQDPVTGLAGYVSDDQLTDLEGVPQCWENESYAEFADCRANGGTGRDSLPVHVRVGPYNINPEDAMDHASVIAHEYGHHLGLPDYYAGYSAYNDWNLMAADYSQHMTIFSKQELGWVVPKFLQPGETRNVSDWEEIKNDTGKIEWQTPSGQAYTLSAANGDQNIHNSEAYALKLPPRLIIDPEKVRTQASAPYVWWSGRGNDFGCAPKAGHNLDVNLPELEFVPEGTPITVSFKSSWDIEWDFDYGFVLASTDGTSYSSLASQRGYTTSKAVNPHNSACLNNFDNGLTGTSGAAAGGPARVAVDRGEDSYDSGSPFIADQYDLSSYAGKRGVVLRFSYFTDPGLDRPGWFIDDLEIKAGNQVIYSSDFSEEDELRLFPGGCNEGMKVAAKCTDGWSRIKADEPSALDHAYYLELRDRSGFDFNGRGQSDRGAIGWDPGVLVEYTDEVRGYGNNGGPQPPRQHYIDSRPQPRYDCGNNIEETHPEPGVLTPFRCRDAAFTTATGDSRFRDVGWVDNFNDDSSPDGLWHFDYGCLTLDVLGMAGHTANSEALPSDLTANARITAGAGCAVFKYSTGVVNAAPTAVASATPKTAGTGEPVTFDAAGSFDDSTPADQLVYRWNFGDGSPTATGQSVTRAYAARGSYTATLTVTDAQGLTGTATVTVTVLGPDLQVTNLVVAQQKGREGEKVKVTATIQNAGPGIAPASKTEFLLDGTNVLGLANTAALAKGASTEVAIVWDTRNVKGQHEIKATADKTGLVAEENENNNSATRTVEVKGNKVENGDFETQNAAGTAPESWSSQSTGAGTTSYTSSGGSDGSHGAQMQGSGGNAAVHGSPSWTSAPIAVTGGATYDVTASVNAIGASSAPAVSLAYLSATGQVLDTVKLLTAPLATNGFADLEKAVAIPIGVAEIRIVLTGFAPTDFATAGTVTFDNIGLYAR
ncbi:MAG: immune inhibitor A [Thermoleophilia bacterium]|nr:immune inhibitor A [Thermoleophilia bacterium]